MKKHFFFVFVILFGVACPASLNAAVTEEWKNIGEVNQEQAQGDVSIEEPSTLEAEEAAKPKAHLARVDSRAADETLVAESSEKKEDWKRLSLTPLVGGSVWQGAWSGHVYNQIPSLGLDLNIPVSRLFSAEIEGGYGNFIANYGNGMMSAPGAPFIFNQYLLGASGKVYFTEGAVRPYLGAGLMAVAYDNMFQLSNSILQPGYVPITGDANLMAGVDFRVAEGISIGAKGQWLIPFINRPYAPAIPTGMGVIAAPGYEQAAMVSSGFFRLMGAVTFKL